ncbi:MAG: hypothetical protein JXJ18_13295 [Rhodobacteraceae bacterium]|nr:hypothetical protein [Paracoccaceae bacterium]
MKFKMILVITKDEKTDLVTETARASGATGCTVITNARGEGLKPKKSFMGLTVEGQRDIVLLLVEEHVCRHILEEVSAAAGFETEPGNGVAMQIDIEDVIGLGTQIASIRSEIEEEDL